MFRWLVVVLAVSLTMMGCHAALPLDSLQEDSGADATSQADAPGWETVPPDGPLADQDLVDLGPPDAPVPDSPSPDAPSPDRALPDKAVPDVMPAPDGPMTGPLTCMGSGNTYQMPSFSKACTVLSDCHAGAHQIDCAGTLKIIGINKAHMVLFSKEEQNCRQSYIPCKMKQGPTTTEDGSQVFAGATPYATCVAGACRSHIKECGFCSGSSTCFLCTTPSQPHYECSQSCYADGDCVGKCYLKGKPAPFCSMTPLTCL